jgi:mRNA interferase MazF
MTPFEFGDVILVRFPFTSQANSKQRPAVVVSNRSYNDTRPDVVAMAITSATDGASIAVTDWKEAGLLRESVFKPIFATFEQTLIQRKLGALTNRDQATLRAIIRDVFG